MSLDAPGLVIREIERVLQTLDLKENPFEEAVKRLSKLEDDWEFAYLTTLEAVQGSSAEKRKATAFTTTVSANPEMYQQLRENRAEVKATRAVVGLLEAKLSALQSVLRAQSRDQWTTTQAQPAWAGRS